jgi:hypothetical protein
MSLKDIVASVEAGVEGFLPAKATEPSALRGPVLKQIKRAEDQWARPQSGETPDWFSQDADRIAFSPTLANGASLTIDGLTTTFVPADRFADYLVNMRTQVEQGAFDAEIEAGLQGSPNVSGLATVPMPAARQGTSEEIRREQQAEALHRDGRNPDGSIIHAVGERPDARAIEN